jgi:REP element-mobilizing transposase RayT
VILLSFNYFFSLPVSRILIFLRDHGALCTLLPTRFSDNYDTIFIGTKQVRNIGFLLLFSGILGSWRCSLIEFGGEEDHVHLLIDIHPALKLSALINNLKSASSRRIRNAFPDHIKRFYWKPVFWHRAYFAGTAGKVTLEMVRRYVEQQGTKEKPRKQ